MTRQKRSFKAMPCSQSIRVSTPFQTGSLGWFSKFWFRISEGFMWISGQHQLSQTITNIAIRPQCQQSAQKGIVGVEELTLPLSPLAKLLPRDRKTNCVDTKEPRI